jgi:two-component system, chemotaxis family, sensor histidine kinase and response regulator WspE
MNTPMLELYRTETITHCRVIETACAHGNPGPLEPLEHAAGQVQGAAKIVGVESAADIARDLVTLFSGVRRGVQTWSPAQRDNVLAATTKLRQIADNAVSLGRQPEGSEDPERTHKLTPEAHEIVEAPEVQSPRLIHDASLLEMFREEVKSLCNILAEGLVALEQDPTDPRAIEPLMRAAHSIKGAGRIVGVDLAVDLAHVLEEVLVTAQHGKLILNQADIDGLLQGTDWLAQLADADLATWSVQHRGGVAQSIKVMEATLRGEQLPVAAKPVPVVVPQVAEPLAKAEAAPEPEAKDRVIRVSAQSLTRLLSLAGESLVEARWLQPFAQSMLRLKKFQDHLADVLEEQACDPDVQRRLNECRRVLAERIDEFEQHASRSDDLNSRLYREVIASRMRPFADGTQGLTRMVRDVARQLGKQVKLEVRGQETDVDRDILDKLEAPLGHMLRNAIDHGLEMPDVRLRAGKPEAGTLKLEARHQAGMLNIRVSDDGRGIDLDRLRVKVVEKKLTTTELASRLSEAELLDFLFLPGFSTAEQVTDVSGRGVGLDAVQSMAQAVGGLLRVHSKFGQGTTFELQLPITLSVMRAVLVRIGGEPFAWPLNRTDRLIKLATNTIQTLEGKPHFECDGRHVGLVPGRLIFGTDTEPAMPEELAVVLIGDRSNQYGLIVDDFLGEQDLVVRPLDSRLGKVPNIAAAAVLDDGSPVLIVDVDDVIRSAMMLVQEGKLRRLRIERAGMSRKKRVLVVDDSAIVREAERQLLLGRDYEVDLAVDGVDGWNAVRHGDYDLVVSDVDMPRMTGLEFVRAMRSEVTTSSMPVVIVSYKDREEDRERGLEVGANAYLTKSSFHDGRFLDTIEELIGPPSSELFATARPEN